MGNLNTNCRYAMTQYLLNKQPLYRIRIPLALIVSIVGTTYINKMFKLDGFVSNLVVPLALLCGSMLIVEGVCKSQLDKEEVNKLTLRCQNWRSDPKNKTAKGGEPPIIPALVINYKDSSKEKDNQVMEHHKYLQHLTAQHKQDVAEHMANIKDDDAEPQHPSHHELSLEADRASKENYETFVENMKVRAFDQESDSPGNEFSSVKAHNQQNVMNGCLMPGKEYAQATCSGTTGYNKLYNPIPGPTWQVQSAATVQNRLVQGNYVPSTCGGCSAPNTSY